MLAQRRSTNPGPVAVAAMLLGIAACASAPPESRLLTKHTELTVDTAQLRLQVRSLARPFSGIVEGAADRILAQAETPTERISALRFKIEGVPAIQGALFEVDPVAALFETAVLIEQSTAFLVDGPAADLSPVVREGVLASLDDMRARLEDLGEQIGASPEGRRHFWAIAEGWAREHPITGSFASRETARSLLAEYLASKPRGFAAVAGRLEESTSDLALRFDLYAEFLAKQIRWQAELLLEESLAAGVPERAMNSVEPVQIGITDLPIDIATEREAIIRALQSERGLILDWIRAERLETLDFVTLERRAIAEVAGHEREAVVDALRSEREAILAEVAAERAAVMDDLARIAADTVEASRVRVIDHLFWRVVQILAVVLPLGFVAAWFLIWYAKRQ
jgi:hypothetical protein